MSDAGTALTTLGVAAVMAVGCMPLVIGVLRRMAVVDVADHRSSHTGQVLRGGGLAVLIGAAAGMLVGSLLLDSVSDGLVVAVVVSLVFAAIGFVDDLHVLPALVRLGAQVVLAGAFVLLVPVDGVGWLAGVAAALWLVLFVNAFNFMDGINGISGLTSFLVAGGLAITALRWGSADLAVAGAALAGASLGFLPWNFPNAKVFLGDVGSYVMGTALSALAVLLLIEGAPPAAVLLPFALYVADVLVTIVRRLRKGENILKSHRDHTYQRLANGGLGHVRTTALAATLEAALVGLGQAAGDQQTAVQAGMILLAAISVTGYLMSPRWLVSRVQPATEEPTVETVEVDVPGAQAQPSDSVDLPEREELRSRAVRR